MLLLEEESHLGFFLVLFKLPTYLVYYVYIFGRKNCLNLVKKNHLHRYLSSNFRTENYVIFSTMETLVKNHKIPGYTYGYSD